MGITFSHGNVQQMIKDKQWRIKRANMTVKAGRICWDKKWFSVFWQGYCCQTFRDFHLQRVSLLFFISRISISEDEAWSFMGFFFCLLTAQKHVSLYLSIWSTKKKWRIEFYPSFKFLASLKNTYRLSWLMKLHKPHSDHQRWCNSEHQVNLISQLILHSGFVIIFSMQP